MEKEYTSWFIRALCFAGSLKLVRYRYLFKQLHISQQQGTVSVLNEENLALIKERFEDWKDGKFVSPLQTNHLHSELVKLIHVTDAAILRNQPPVHFVALSLQSQQILSGITPTVSTITGAFMPSLTMLENAFNQLRDYSALTEGGRAFTKHCHRCSNGWWGSAKGSAQEINERALTKVRNIMKEATWKNAFYLPGTFRSASFAWSLVMELDGRGR